MRPAAGGLYGVNGSVTAAVDPVSGLVGILREWARARPP